MKDNDTFDDKLGEILDNYASVELISKEEAKQAIKDLILSDVVGEDVTNVYVEHMDKEMVRHLIKKSLVEKYKSELRAEQRNIINGKENSNE